MREVPTFSNWGKIYKVEEINYIIEELKMSEIIKTNKKIEYYNIPCAFDIETSSFLSKGISNQLEKTSIMYEWTLGLNGYVIIGRTWEEFFNVINILADLLGLYDKKRLIIYVHNLSYEFQYIRKWLEWVNVFSLDSRKPLYALSTLGIEFRCSYLLSGYSLSKLDEQLQKYKVSKMVGDLDYKLIRHSTTTLTEKEIKYCENDVRVIMSYIQEKIENDGNITRIPLTKTGYVRTYCKNNCLYDGSHKKNTKKYVLYTQLMQGMTLEVDEYQQLKRAFIGGFTHASAWKSGKVFSNVQSYDFTSSYPSVMVSEKFPMSKSEKIIITSSSEFYHNIKMYCCLFDVKIIGLQSKTLVEHYISVSKCFNLKTVVEDNGRVVSAKELSTTITEQDFLIIKNFYTWESIEIGNFRRYKKGYLPKSIILSILKLYADKTKLKDVLGKELEYLCDKELINSLYGMIVTDICRDDIPYENEWLPTEPPDIQKALNKYNGNKRRFLFYPWGVWVTAYARKNLFTGIHELGEDYIYSDTDSIKGLNFKNHTKYIKEYNMMIDSKLKLALKYHGIDENECRPKTIKGIEKPLGFWDEEKPYDKFKTIGAKRYIYEQKGKVNFTVSGLNKSICIPYLYEEYKTNDKIFEVFEDGLFIPPDYTGKMTHTYIDEDRKGVIKDYNNVPCDFYEKSSVHLENADYNMSQSETYIKYLLGITTKEN